MDKHGQGNLRARTHTPTLGESALESPLESADDNAESANSTTYFTIVSQLPISNMFFFLFIIIKQNHIRGSPGLPVMTYIRNVIILGGCVYMY